MLTFVAVTVNPTPGSKPSLPSTIANTWILDFKRFALQDVFAGRFGAQRHPLPSYTIMYRLDVMPEVLRHAATLSEAGIEATENEESPSFDEILGMAKVWLAFDENVEVCVSWF